MRAYTLLRNWVDQFWRPGRWQQPLLLPPLIVGLVWSIFFRDSDIVMWIAISFAALWTIFLGWRWVVEVKRAKREVDARRSRDD